MRLALALPTRLQNPLPKLCVCQADLPTAPVWVSQSSYYDLDNNLVECLEDTVRDGYRYVRGMYRFPFFGRGEKPIEMQTCYTEDGHYVGDWRWGEALTKRGIAAEVIDSSHRVCSVGFCKARNSWAGWSHRALCEFTIGDKLFEERYIFSGDTPFVQCGKVTIKTLAQAREAAVNFANYVS